MKSPDSQWMSPTVVVAAIIQQDGKFLIAKRRAESDMGGFWEFPGGKIEPGETLQIALFREMQEELGIEINVPHLFYSLTYQYPHKNVELHFFTCSIQLGQPQALGCDEVMWVTKQELTCRKFLPANSAVIEKILATESATFS